MISDTDTRTWKDLNGDNVAQLNELGPSQNQTFGIRQNAYPDPNIERPFEMEYVVKIDHQLARGVAVSAGYYRRGFYRPIHGTKLSTRLSGYSPLTITSPLDRAAITLY